MRSIPTITKNLLIINILAFAAYYVLTFRNIDLNDILGLHFFLASDFKIYQMLTYMFMHGGLEHLFFNMFALWMFGCVVENIWGPKKFLFYYIFCGIGAGLVQELAQYVQYSMEGLAAYDSVMSTDGIKVPMDSYLNLWTTVGASGAIYAILLAFGMSFPEERIFIFPLPIPIKAKYFVTGYAVIELMSALGRANDGVAHFAHLGGMLFGLLLILYWKNGGGRGGHRSGYYERHYEGGSDGWSFRKWFSSLTKKKPHINMQRGGKYGQDMAYRQKEKEDEAELDRILDKVRRQGYGGLTEEEKKRLFDFSQKK